MTTDYIVLNHWERAVKDLAGEIHDVAYDDAPEAIQKLHGLVALASEQLARVERHASEQADRIAREEIATSVPPIGGF